MKNQFTMALLVIFTGILTSCNMQGQIPAALGIYSGMKVFIPASQLDVAKSTLVFSDEGTPANTSAIFNISNAMGDGRTDYRNVNDPYTSALVAFDVTGDGMTDLVTDPLSGIGVPGFPMDLNALLRRCRERGTGLGSLNGVSGYVATVQYKNYFCAYASRNGDNLLPAKYSATLVFE